MDSPKDKSPPMLSQFDLMAKDQQDKVQALKKITASRSMPSNELVAMYRKGDYVGIAKSAKPKLDKAFKKALTSEAYSQLPIKDMFDNPDSKTATCKMYKFCFENTLGDEQKSAVARMLYILSNPDVGKKVAAEFERMQKSIDDHTRVLGQVQHTLKKAMDLKKADKLENDVLYSDVYGILQYVRSEELDPKKNPEKVPVVNLVHPKDANEMIKNISAAKADVFYTAIKDEKGLQLTLANSVLAKLSKDKKEITAQTANVFKFAEECKQALKGARSSDPKDDPKKFSSTISYLFEEVDAIKKYLGDEMSRSLVTINAYLQQYKLATAAFTVMNSHVKAIVRTLTDVTQSTGGNMQPKTLTAALEAMERSDEIDYEFINNFDQYVKETQRVTAGLEAISNRIRMTGVISLHDVKALEAIEPGILSAHPNTKHIRFTTDGSKVGVVAALEAIEWKTVGKWGIIGVIIAAIAALIRRVIKGRVDNKADALLRDIKETTDGIDRMYASFGISGLMAAEPEVLKDALDMTLNLQRQRHQNTIDTLDDMLRADQQKSSIQGTATEVKYGARGITVDVDFSKEYDDDVQKIDTEFDKKVGRFLTGELKSLGVNLPPKFHLSKILGKEFDANLKQRVDQRLTELGILHDDDVSVYMKDFIATRAIAIGLKAPSGNYLHINHILTMSPPEFAVKMSSEYTKLDPDRAANLNLLLGAASLNNFGGEIATVKTAHDSLVSCIEKMERFSTRLIQAVTSLLSDVKKGNADALMTSKFANVHPNSPDLQDGGIPIAMGIINAHHEATMAFITAVRASNPLQLGADFTPMLRWQSEAIKAVNFTPLTPEFKQSVQTSIGRSTAQKAPSGNSVDYLKSALTSYYNDPKGVGELSALKSSIEHVLSVSDAKRIENFSKGLTDNLKEFQAKVAELKRVSQTTAGFDYWEKRVFEIYSTTASDVQFLESQMVLMMLRFSGSLSDFDRVVTESLKYFKFCVEVQLAHTKQTYALRKYVELASK